VRDRLQDRNLVAVKCQAELGSAAHVGEPGAGVAVLVEQFKPDGCVAPVRVSVGRDGRSDAALVIDDLEPSRS